MNITNILDPDIWWHLKTGEVILSLKAIPTTDIYSYTINGQPWLTFEWLSQILFYGLYFLGGTSALTLFKAFILSVTFGILFWMFRHRPLVAAPVIIFGALSIRGFFVVRPQIFDYLFLVLLIQKLFRLSKRDSWNWKHVWWLPLLQILWVNLHGGAMVLGLVGIGLYWVTKPSRRTGVLLGLMILGSLINPHTFKIFTHLYHALTFEGAHYIAEWQAPSLFYGNGAYVGALVLAFLSVLLNFRKNRFAALLVVAFASLSITAVRHISVFVIVLIPCLILAIESFIQKRIQHTNNKTNFLLRKELKPILVACLLIMGTVWQMKTVYRDLRMGLGGVEPLKGAVDFIEREGIKGRQFNEYGQGGYLIWRGYPDRPVFVDGRNVEYGSEFFKKSHFWFKPDVWRDLDAQYNFDYAVIGNGKQYFCEILDNDPQWALVFWDDLSLVYVKRQPQFAALINKHEYTVLKPNNISPAYLAKTINQPGNINLILAELDHSISQSPQSLNAHLLKANFLSQMGRYDEAVYHAKAAREAAPWKKEPDKQLARLQEQVPNTEKARDWTKKGISFLNDGFRRDAIDAFRTALRYDPAFSPARNNLGYVYHLEKQYPEAYETLNQVIRSEKNLKIKSQAERNLLALLQDSEAIDSLSSEEGRIWKAETIDLLKRIVQSDPENPEAHLALGMAYMNSTKVGFAFESFDKASELASINPEGQLNRWASLSVHKTLASYYQQINLLSKAQKEQQIVQQMENDER